MIGACHKIQFLSQNIKNTLVVKDKHAKFHCQLDIKSQRYIYTLETSWKANTFDRKRLIFSCSIREIFRPSYSWWKKEKFHDTLYTGCKLNWIHKHRHAVFLQRCLTIETSPLISSSYDCKVYFQETDTSCHGLQTQLW